MSYSLSRRDFLKKTSAISATAVFSRPTSFAAEVLKDFNRPNLVFMFPDQFRRQAIGFMKQDPVITPRLDAFCEQSLVLTDAVSSYPICSPFRAQLFTGKYPISNGVTTNCNSAHDVMLKKEQRCLTDILHDNGYCLGYLGKWHLDKPHEPFVGRRRGRPGKPGGGIVWDEFVPPERRHGIEFWHAYNCRDQHLNPRYWTTNAKRTEPILFDEWSTKHEADVAIEYIRNPQGKYRDPKKPFALFIAPNPPHTPFDQVPKKYVEMYEGTSYRDLLNRPNVDIDNPHPQAKQHVKNYFAAVTGTDEQFGRILDVLKEQGLEENTIVVFTADHGEMMGSQNLMHKGFPYEESIGIPFIIRWPGKIPLRRDDLLLTPTDMMPSLLGLMGLKDSLPHDVEGIDYSSIMLGQPGTRPASALYLTCWGTHGGARGLRTHRYTFSMTPQKDGKKKVLLFDNQQDPYQLNNLAESKPKVVQELTDELARWLRKTSDPWKV
ncbi:MAG: sulfatase-like hydrolase/transferase [Sedimentisphaerales bacterium]|nr:sulfatase-like hydrolase/transferase [Sedimentisphaerales bacterium]